jgi:hypothetical protein
MSSSDGGINDRTQGLSSEPAFPWCFLDTLAALGLVGQHRHDQTTSARPVRARNASRTALAATPEALAAGVNAQTWPSGLALSFRETGQL